MVDYIVFSVFWYKLASFVNVSLSKLSICLQVEGGGEEREMCCGLLTTFPLWALKAVIVCQCELVCSFCLLFLK